MMTTKKLALFVTAATEARFAPEFDERRILKLSAHKDEGLSLAPAITFRGREDYLAWTLAWRRAHATAVEGIRQRRIERRELPDLAARDSANLGRWRLRAYCRHMQAIRLAAKREAGRQREESLAAMV